MRSEIIRLWNRIKLVENHHALRGLWLCSSFSQRKILDVPHWSYKTFSYILQLQKSISGHLRATTCVEEQSKIFSEDTISHESSRCPTGSSGGGGGGGWPGVRRGWTVFGPRGARVHGGWCGGEVMAPRPRVAPTPRKGSRKLMWITWWVHRKKR